MRFSVHEFNAKNFINNVLAKSRLQKDVVINHLEEKIRSWNTEESQINAKNVFDLTDTEFERRNYLVALSDYGNIIVRRYRSENLGIKKPTVEISGDNLTIKITS